MWGTEGTDPFARTPALRSTSTSPDPPIADKEGTQVFAGFRAGQSWLLGFVVYHVLLRLSVRQLHV
jgi:hypothetical protein